MEENKSQMNEHTHGGMCWCHGYGHRHFWLRWLIGIAILAIVFCLGMKIGEFKGEFRNGYYGGYDRHMMRYYPSMMGGYGEGYFVPGMMQNNSSASPAPAPSNTNTQK